ncbi:MAG TPA: hypothetical protein VFY98_05215 [Intrasporangium sp.]|nr:hypothetical protein [Intrasporangium sp.]
MIAARRVAAILSAVAVLGGTGWSAWSSSSHDSKSADLNAVAIASPADPTATDEAFAVTQLGSGRNVSGDASAGADTTGADTTGADTKCDGCTSTATTVSVIYGNRTKDATVDNLATSTTSHCTDCGSAAVSVQVVILRHPQNLVANNRSFAANVACKRCTSNAAAYQIVVVAPRGDRLDSRELAELREWARSEASGPAQSTMGLRSAGKSSTQRELEDQLRGALGPITTVTYDADVKAG